MAAPVSVVIPTLEAADRIGPCLAALVEGVAEGLVAELVITDGGSADAIAEIAEETGARLVAAPRGRGTQLRAGAKAARGDWLLFLHADTVLPPGWPAAVRAQIEAGPGRAGHFRLAFDTPGALARLTAGWANLRARALALPYGDQGLLVHRDLYEAVGGYPPVPLMEDVAIVRALGRRRLTELPATAVTSAERYARAGWLRRGWRNLTTLGLFFLGVRPERLEARYRQ
jgi:rSAM/selenodomain-associated transferase 2